MEVRRWKSFISDTRNRLKTSISASRLRTFSSANTIGNQMRKSKKLTRQILIERTALWHSQAVEKAQQTKSATDLRSSAMSNSYGGHNKKLSLIFK